MMKIIARIGDLTSRFELLRDTSPTQASGGRRPWQSYSVVATFCGQLIPLDGREILASIEAPVAIHRFDVITWRREAIKPTMRLKMGERTFNVLAAPMPPNDHRFMRISAEEIL